MATKNLGQVAGVHIGTTPPENTILIWYDSTPSQRVHKTYDPSLGQWVVLQPSVISRISYSELVNTAKGSGLTVGQWFKITDRNNALAYALTATKVHYCDAMGNILIDDLGTNIQYHVTSSNLTIDGVTGTFIESTRKLDFTLTEDDNLDIDGDYLMIKGRRANAWKLLKTHLSSLLSKTTGNSLRWNGGLFFDFTSSLSSVIDREGGVVGRSTFDLTVENLNSKINSVAKDNQQITVDTTQIVADATTDEKIYDKALPSINLTTAPTDILAGNTLLTIISKIQSWINFFKYATGIRISANFAPSSTPTAVSPSDNVNSAISKLQGYANQHTTRISDINTRISTLSSAIDDFEESMNNDFDDFKVDVNERLEDMKTMIENINLTLPDDYTPGTSFMANIDGGDSFQYAISVLDGYRKKGVDISSGRFNGTLGGTSLQMDVMNGTLCVNIPVAGVKLGWGYSRFAEEDYTRFFEIDFPSNILKILRDNIRVYNSDIPQLDARSLVSIGTVAMSNVSGGMANMNDSIVLANASFGFYGPSSLDFVFGIVLRPLVAYWGQPESYMVKAGRITFCDLLGFSYSVVTDVEFTLMPGSFQYKIW